MVRVTDSLLPQIAMDFDSSVGAASMVVAAYSVSHGSVQLLIGPIADRFGKYRMVAIMCALATGFPSSLTATAPAPIISPNSARDSPRWPTVTAPIG